MKDHHHNESQVDFHLDTDSSNALALLCVILSAIVFTFKACSPWFIFKLNRRESNKVIVSQSTKFRCALLR